MVPIDKQSCARRRSAPGGARVIALALLALIAVGGSLTARAQPAPLRILPLGDSITHTADGHDGYRRDLWQLLSNAQYNVDFVGSMSNLFCEAPPPTSDYDYQHEGHWGWRADEVLNGRVDDGCSGSGSLAVWLQGYTPDVVLMHLGTNDLVQANTVASTVSELEQLIDVLRAANPNVTILLAQLIPAQDGTVNTRIMLLNAEIPGIAARKTLPGSPVIAVDQNTGFDVAVDTYDGYHPSTTGAAKIAQRWYAALQPLLAPPAATPTSTATSTATGTATDTPTATATATATDTPTATATATATSTATDTATATATSTATDTPTSTATAMPTSTATDTPTSTSTSTATSTATATLTPTLTSTPTATRTQSGDGALRLRTFLTLVTKQP